MRGGPLTFDRTPWAIFTCSGDCASGRARPPGPPASTRAVRCPLCGGACQQLRGSGAPPTRGRFLGDRPALLFSTPAPAQSGALAFDHRPIARRITDRAHRRAHAAAVARRVAA